MPEDFDRDIWTLGKKPMERKIVVPEGMLKSAMRAWGKSLETDPQSRILSNILEAALRWLSENPQVPTESQLAEITAKAKKRASDEPWSHSGEHWATFYSVEWQKMMFLAPEPEIPKELNDLIPPGHMACGKGLDDLLAEAYRRGKNSK